MAEEPEKSGQEPNLELPSLLGFGRRKKRRQAESGPDESAPDRPAVTEDPLAADPVPEPRGGLAPAADRAKRLPPVPPPVRTEVAPPPQVTSPPSAREPQPEPEPAPTEPQPTEPVVVHEPPRPVTEEPVAEEPEAAAEETAVLTSDALGTPPLDEPHGNDAAHEEPLGWPEEDSETVASTRHSAAPVTAPPDPEESEAAQGSDRAERSSWSPTLPALNPRIAALLAGALVGLSGVLLAFVAQRGCELVRGVGSCGGIGLLALLLILAFEVLLGAALLKAWRLSDPASTSFLGVGLMAVVVLLFLLSSLDSVWMVLVIPVLSALTFLTSWWVTATFVEGVADDRMSR